MAATGSCDGDDAFGSFEDDGFGSFEDGDATGAVSAVANADDDQPTSTHDVTETANNNTDAEVDGGSLVPPPDTGADFPADVDAGTPPDSSNAKDSAGGDENAARNSTTSEESPAAPSNDISPGEPEQESQESDAPLALPSPPPSPSPPEIPSAEEAMESADETATAPEATTAPLSDLASPDDAADGTSPPPISAGDISTDSPGGDPFASLGVEADAPLPVLSGSADAAEGGFESFGGFRDMSGGDDLLGANPSEKEEKTGEVEDTTDMNENGAQIIGADTIGAELEAISTELPSPTPVANPPLDQLSSFVTAATEEEEVAGTEDVAPSTEDQDDGVEIGNASNNDDEDEDDFGGFEDAASEEEEKKDGSPIADKISMTAISDTVDSTDTIPPALPLETSEDVAPAETLAPAADEEATEFIEEVAPSNDDVLTNDMPESPDEHTPEPVESTEDDFDAFEEAPVAIAAAEVSDPEAASEESNYDGFDAFAEAPAPSSSPERADKMDASDAPAPAPAPDSDDDSKPGEGATKEEDGHNDDDEFGDFDAFAEAPASSAPPNDTHQSGEFDAPVPAPEPVATMEASEPDEEKAEEDAEVEQQQEEQVGDDDDDKSDDDFGDFGDFGGISEAGEISASEEVNVADMPVEFETSQQEAATSPPEKDSDDEDDDFGDFGDFDEAPAAEPAAATDAISVPTAPKAEPIPADQGFGASFKEQASTPMGHSTPAESDPIIQKATVVCKGMFQQYASSPLEEEGEESKEVASMPVKSILDSILAGEDSGPTVEPSSTLSSKEKMENIFSETQIERGPAKLIMNYDMPKPYAQYAADSGADLKTDRGLSLEASSHSNDGDVFVPEVLSIDLPKESELSPEPRVPKSQVEPSAEFVDFPMSATRVVIPDKKEVNADEGGFASFGDSAAEAATPPAAEPESAVDKFLAKIPDLSFMLRKELVLPK